jgi:galactose mutarotase-like enzyme
VTLVLDKPMPGFEDLQATLTYAYKQTGFEAILKVKNTGEIALRVSPGLHPYFAITGRPELNGRVIDTTLTDETEFMQTEVHQLKTGLLDPILSSQDLTTWAVWSGKSPDYLCVEPTQNGNSFSEKAISASELLEPGQSRQYTFQIQW